MKQDNNQILADFSKAELDQHIFILGRYVSVKLSYWHANISSEESVLSGPLYKSVLRTIRFVQWARKDTF